MDAMYKVSPHIVHLCFCISASWQPHTGTLPPPLHPLAHLSHSTVDILGYTHQNGALQNAVHTCVTSSIPFLTHLYCTDSPCTANAQVHLCPPMATPTRPCVGICPPFLWFSAKWPQSWCNGKPLTCSFTFLHQLYCHTPGAGTLCL